MEYLLLSNSDLRVSRFCMGGCPMGGYGWGNVQENELLDAIASALDNGVNFFDTAETYGLGHAERILAKGLGVHRQDVVIQSKFGVRVQPSGTIYDNSPKYIRQALEGTLQRLNTDYVDIYTIHYRDGKTPLEVVMDTLISLKKEGKIRYIGLSNVHGKEIQEFMSFKGEFVTCQDEFSLACRKNEADLRNLQTQLDVTPMTWGSLGQGILTGKYTRDNIKFGKNDRRSRDVYVNFHGAKLEQNLKIVEVLKTIATSHKRSIASCAIRYILETLKNSVVIAGVKCSAQLLSNVEAMNWTLDSNDLNKLNACAN